MFRIISISLLVLGSFAGTAATQPQTERLIDLRGQWKFMIGDQATWNDPEFDDSAWPQIFVPATWEDEGYQGYNGYAWYRWTGTLRDGGLEQSYIIDLGRVDDVDQTFVNGCLVGSQGSFPPRYSTGYYAWRWYRIPKTCLRDDGRLVIAVRVYDSELSGGIIEGQPAIHVQPLPAGTVLNLAGIWKFQKGDNLLWMQPSFNDSHWGEHKVPLKWSENDLGDYNGFGWYRTKFVASNHWDGDSFTLELGMIDDVDEVYLNGVRIGKTDPFPGTGAPGVINTQWMRIRRYTIPDGLLHYGKENVLAVRVYDNDIEGGMLGPFTVIRRTDAITSSEWAESMPSSQDSDPASSQSTWFDLFLKWWRGN
jgi:sialate O-acetylesterase